MEVKAPDDFFLQVNVLVGVLYHWILPDLAPGIILSFLNAKFLVVTNHQPVPPISILLLLGLELNRLIA